MLNEVRLIGNLGKDAEVSYTPSGIAVANLSLATTERWTDKTTGETREKTEWHRIVCFDKLAEMVGKMYKKGKQVFASGTLQTRTWVDKSDITRYTTEIKATRLRLLGPAPGGGASSPTPPMTDADIPPEVLASQAAVAESQTSARQLKLGEDDNCPF